MTSTRRAALRYLAAVIATALPGTSALAARESPSELAARKVVDVLRLGASLPALPAAHADARPLAVLLADACGLSPAAIVELSTEQLRQHLCARITADYRQNRLASRGGWLLSVTESDSIALAHLVAVTRAS